MDIPIRLYRTENHYFNEKLAAFLCGFKTPIERDTAAKTMSFILNNYPETHLFLRGDKVGESTKEIGD